MTKVLVVDDEPGVLRFVRRAFEAVGYEVETAVDGVDGLRRASQTDFDLITLDLALPGLGGMAVLTAIVEQDPAARVLVLSAVEGAQTRVRCLELGAVDYLQKPFAVAELIARAHTRLRSDVHVPSSPQLVVGKVKLDPIRRTAQVGERTLELSARESLVLAHMMRRPNEVCSRQELLSDVWGLDFDPGSNVVDVCVSRLRSKFNDDSIATVRNVGYRFCSA